MRFWCRQCQSRVGVRSPQWRVNTVGKPHVGGMCSNCGDEVLRRITKLSDAPSGIAAEARAVGQAYQHWRKARTRERDQQLRALALLFEGNKNLIEKLADGFGLHPRRVRLILEER